MPEVKLTCPICKSSDLLITKVIVGGVYFDCLQCKGDQEKPLTLPVLQNRDQARLVVKSAYNYLRNVDAKSLEETAAMEWCGTTLFNERLFYPED